MLWEKFLLCESNEKIKCALKSIIQISLADILTNGNEVV